jgi:hypothetical protein
LSVKLEDIERAKMHVTVTAAQPHQIFEVHLRPTTPSAGSSMTIKKCDEAEKAVQKSRPKAAR